jgi:hypothetical protein
MNTGKLLGLLALLILVSATGVFAQAPQNRIPQQIVLNGQSANGAYVMASTGGMQSFTCANPQQYATPDGGSQGWACYDQASGVWLLNAVPPKSSQDPVAVPPPAQAPLPPPPQAPVAVPQQAPLPASPPPGAPSYPAAELDRIVSPIALYPDPLLAQVLAAATFYDQIPDAARWADQHHYLNGAALTAAMAADQVPWDPSVQALLPFPSVLDMMAGGMPWTQELGNAFLTQPANVMDAVQRMRQSARSFGYLRSNGQVIVSTGRYVEILPVNPDYIVVPYYDPLIVFAAPRRGFVVTTGIRFGFGVTLGAVFAPWGWHANRFLWDEHVVIVNNAPWRRTWGNRAVYIHPYTVPRYAVRREAEQHRAIERSGREREDERLSRDRREDHH